MASPRYLFGSGASDFAIAPPSRHGGFVVSAANLGNGTLWSASSGGIQYTDLQTVNGGAIATISTDEDGGLVAFYGPPGVDGAWLDFGGGSRAFLPASRGQDAHVAGLIADDSSAAAVALDSRNQTKGDVRYTQKSGLDADVASAIGPDSGSATDVKLRGNFSRVYTPEKYGAVGDGVADDTAAVVACFNAANAKARAGVVASIIHPGALVELKGTYNLATLSGPVEIRCNVRGHSATFLVPAAYADVAVRVGDERASGNYLQSARVELPDVIKAVGATIVAGSVGVRVVNFGNSELSFGRIRLFETGQHYTGWGQGAVYLKVFPGYMSDVKTAFKILPDKAGGWANQIVFVGGSVQQSSGFAGGTRLTGWGHVYIDGNGINNVDEIHFLGTSFEGDVSDNALYVARARNIHFEGCRHEQGTAGAAVTFTAASANVTWNAHGLTVGDMVAFTASSAPTSLNTSSPYYVVSVPDANTVTVSQAKGGAAVTFGSTGTSTFGWRPPRVKLDSSVTLLNVDLDNPYTILGVIEVVDASDNGSGVVVRSPQLHVVDSYAPDDLPIYRARNRAAGAASRPAFAAYPTTVKPRENPRGWTTAIGDRGVLFAASGAEEARLYSSGGVLSWQRAGQSVAQIATSTRSPGLLAVSGLSCTANATTTIDFALSGAAVNDHLNVTVLGALPAGIIFSHAWVVSAGNIRVAFVNTTAGAISVTQNLQAISFSRFF